MGLSPSFQAMSWYARKKGWQVFPCRFKAPLTANGLLDATTNPQLIKAWAERWPDAGVAIRTGALSGIFVLDVDPRHGGDDSLAALLREHGPLPPTVEAITGGGGRHLFFGHPGGYIKNTENTPRPGLDIRGDGGYVVAAPSIHESGRKYVWEVSSRPDAAPVAEAPAWLLDLLSRKPEHDSGAEPLPDLIYEGGRDGLLTSMAGSMRRRGASENAILAALTVENAARCMPPLPDQQVAKIARSVARYEPAGMAPDGIDLWASVAGDRFQESGEEIWDEFAADLAVGAMLYRLGNTPTPDLSRAFEAAYREKSYRALETAIAEFERAAHG